MPESIGCSDFASRGGTDQGWQPHLPAFLKDAFAAGAFGKLQSFP